MTLPAVIIEGQLNPLERAQISSALLELGRKDLICLEVGTYKGGGSTLQILAVLAKTGGTLFGIEASPTVFREMRAALLEQEPDLCRRFHPILGFSQEQIPALIQSGQLPKVDLVFLDGGNNPKEQIQEFRLLDPLLPIGGTLMSHDALLRKGKWLRRVLPLLDHYQTEILKLSEEGLLVSKKIRLRPSWISRLGASACFLYCCASPVELAALLFPPVLRRLFLKSSLPVGLGSWPMVVATKPHAESIAGSKGEVE